MSFLTFIVFHALWIKVAATEPWSCAAELTGIDFSNGPVYIPSKTDVYLQYKSNMHCYWALDIPRGKYATVKVLSNFAHDDYFLIYNNQGYRHSYHQFAGDLSSKLNNTFYLPEDHQGTYVELQAKDVVHQGYLSLVIELHNLPVPSNSGSSYLSGQTVLPLDNLFQVQKVFNSDKEYVYRIAAEDYDFRYDSCFVYSGNNPLQEQFLTGLASQSFGVPKRFNGTTTVICLGNDFPTAYLVAAPAPVDMDDQSVWILRTGDYIYTRVDAFNSDTGKYHPAYLTTYCPNGCTKYIKNVDASYNSQAATLDIYNGNPVEGLEIMESILATDANKYYIPQQITGIWSTFVLNNGTANIDITSQNDQWAIAKPGRKGFIAAPYLDGKNSTLNTTFKTINGNWITFSYVIDQLSGGSVEVSVNQGNGHVYRKSFTPSTTKIGEKVSYQGNSMTISIQPPSVKGTTKVSFEMTKGAYKSYAALSLLILCLWKW